MQKKIVLTSVLVSVVTLTMFQNCGKSGFTLNSKDLSSNAELKNSANINSFSFEADTRFCNLLNDASVKEILNFSNSSVKEIFTYPTNTPYLEVKCQYKKNGNEFNINDMAEISVRNNFPSPESANNFINELTQSESSININTSLQNSGLDMLSDVSGVRVDGLGDSAVMISSGQSYSEYSYYQATIYFAIGKHMFLSSVFTSNASEFESIKLKALKLAKHAETQLRSN